MDIYLETNKAYLNMITEATKPDENSDGVKLANDLEKALKKEFPKSYVDVTFSNHFMPDITVRIFLGKDKSEWANGIWQNDRLAHTSVITGFNDDGSFKDEKLSVRSETKSWTTDDAPEYMAFGHQKIGWRNFKAKPEQIVPAYIKYAKKIKKTALDNIDKFNPEIQKMIKDKLK